MHDKVVRSEYSDIWHVLWPGFEITMNNTKKTLPGDEGKLYENGQKAMYLFVSM